MHIERTRIVTADNYHRMGKAGMLTEDDRVELLDGQIITKMTIGPRHNASVNRAVHAFFTRAGDRVIVQSQGSVGLTFLTEPEPDVVLLKPREDYYAKKLAAPDDILLIIEVADSSLERDRDVKGPLYADAGVSEYWLVDLTTNTVFCHSDPAGRSYRQVRTCRRGEVIAPHSMPDCTIAVDVLLTE